MAAARIHTLGRMIYIEKTRDGSTSIWEGRDYQRYVDWAREAIDTDEPPDRPTATVTFTEEDLNTLVVQTLRGPTGPPGPVGPRGISA